MSNAAQRSEGINVCGKVFGVPYEEDATHNKRCTAYIKIESQGLMFLCRILIFAHY